MPCDRRDVTTWPEALLDVLQRGEEQARQTAWRVDQSHEQHSR